MARTTSDSVKAVLLRQYNSSTNPDLTGFIETASALVDQLVICAATYGVAHSDATLELIERWLAAHLYTLPDPMYKSKRTGNAAAEYVTDGKGYLGMAQSLDSTGCLERIMGSRKSPSIEWLGLSEPEQTSYRQRN